MSPADRLDAEDDGPAGRAVRPDVAQRRPWWAWLVSPVLACLVLGPLLSERGFGLVGDMIFVPEQPWKPAWFGGDGAVPRAVPSDAWMSVVTHLVSGEVVQRAVLLAILIGAGWGMLALLSRYSTPAALTAAIFYQWNPFVHERLGIGHWALLCGYAVLPWVLRAALRAGAQGWRAGAALLVSVGIAAWSSPSGGLMATAVALVGAMSVRRRRRAVVRALVASVLMNAAWILPGLLNQTSVAADAQGADAFAARADTGFGLVLSLFSLGGMWKSSVDPVERASWVLAGLAIAFCGVALAGLVVAVRGRMGRESAPTWLASITALGATTLTLVVGASAWPGAVGWLIESVPGSGILRDSHKWLALWALPLAVGTAEAVTVAAARFGGYKRWLVAGLVPLVCLPTLSWGLAGAIRPSTYPAEWHTVADYMSDYGAADDRVLVMPLGVYRRFSWAHERAILDPAPRFFPGHFLTDDQLDGRSGTVVSGESADAARLRALADHPDSLGEAAVEMGIGWVLIEHDTPGLGSWPDDVGRVVHSGDQLTLVDLGRGGEPPRSRWSGLYQAVDLASGLIWLLCAAAMLTTTARAMYSWLLSSKT